MAAAPTVHTIKVSLRYMYREWREQIGEVDFDPAHFDPAHFDHDEINEVLASEAAVRQKVR